MRRHIIFIFLQNRCKKSSNSAYLLMNLCVSAPESSNVHYFEYASTIDWMRLKSIFNPELIFTLMKKA